jgi:hypothetical protein
MEFRFGNLEVRFAEKDILETGFSNVYLGKGKDI